MYNYFGKIIIIITAIILLGWTQTASAFSVSPTKTEITVNPGDEQVVNIKIKNNVPAVAIYQLKVVGVRQESGGAPIYGAGLDVAENWIAPAKETVGVGGTDWQTVGFNIKIPKKVLPGTHYLGIVVASKTQGALAGQVISLLAVRVAGTVNEVLTISTWQAVKSFTSERVWQFNGNLKNSGSMELPLRGELSIYNWLGQTIYRAPVVLGNDLLPQSERWVESSLPAQIKFNLPGPYRARLKVAYGLTNQLAAQSAVVWYVPVWVGVVVVILMIGLVILIKKKLFSSSRQN
jgi:hypothetical protein